MYAEISICNNCSLNHQSYKIAQDLIQKLIFVFPYKVKNMKNFSKKNVGT